MGHVQINLFGSFHVERDGKSVDEQLARSPKGMLRAYCQSASLPRMGRCS